MELDLCVVLLFGLCVSNVINAESTGKVSEEKYTYTKFEGYDIEMEQTKNLHGREIAKIKSHNKKSSDLIDRCKDKCSHEYEDDCNIVIYKPDENQCLLMDCGENAGNCYFISSEDSKASGKGEGNTIILQRTEEKEQPEVKGPSDTKSVSKKSSSNSSLVRTVPVKVSLKGRNHNSSAHVRKKSVVTGTTASHSNPPVAAKKLKSWKEGALKLTNMAARLSGRSLLNSNRTPTKSNTTTRNVSRIYVSPPVTVVKLESKKSEVVEGTSVSSSTSRPLLMMRGVKAEVEKKPKGIDIMGVVSLQSTKHYSATRPSQSEPKSSEEDDEDESTTAEAAVQTQKRKEGEVVVGNSKPAQAESDPFSFPASPNDDGSDPAIQGPFEENSTVPQCEQPQRVGPCRAAIPRFFYDKETKACVAFIFGGCNANENNFKTNEECIRACGNKDGVKYFNTNNQQHNLSPYNSAHRGLISTHGSSNLNTAYKLEALIPLFAGSMISLLMIIMIGFRCYVNSKTGPKKLRKMIYDGPPPTVGEFLTDDEIVNGMYT